jgi:cytochrome c
MIAVVLLAASPQPAAAQDVAAGEKVFAKCKVCHQVGETAKNFVGPVLNGVVGRPAGSYPGYNYSEANKASGITWDETQRREFARSGCRSNGGHPLKIRIVGRRAPRSWQ